MIYKSGDAWWMTNSVFEKEVDADLLVALLMDAMRFRLRRLMTSLLLRQKLYGLMMKSRVSAALVHWWIVWRNLRSLKRRNLIRGHTVPWVGRGMTIVFRYQACYGAARITFTQSTVMEWDS